MCSVSSCSDLGSLPRSSSFTPWQSSLERGKGAACCTRCTCTRGAFLCTHVYRPEREEPEGKTDKRNRGRKGPESCKRERKRERERERERGREPKTRWRNLLGVRGTARGTRPDKRHEWPELNNGRGPCLEN